MNAKVEASAYRGNDENYEGLKLTDGNKDTYWAIDDGQTQASLVVHLDKMQTIKYVLLQEYIRLGQRVKSFTVEAWENNTWKQVAAGTTIGYKRILRIQPVATDRIRVNIKDAKACPVLSNLEIY
jgi:alpha-L-fucosidase